MSALLFGAVGAIVGVLAVLAFALWESVGWSVPREPESPRPPGLSWLAAAALCGSLAVLVTAFLLAGGPGLLAAGAVCGCATGAVYGYTLEE